MNHFDTTYAAASAHPPEPDAATAIVRIRRGAVWLHRDGRAITTDSVTPRVLPREVLRMLVNMGAVERDSCPLDSDVDILVTPENVSGLTAKPAVGA